MHTPSSHPSSSTPPTHTGVLCDINNKISELLESQEFLQQDRSLQDLLTRLEEALDTKVNMAGYDYKDYPRRLLWTQEELEAILYQDQELKGLYEELLHACEFAPYFKQRLLEQFLFERLLELGSNPQGLYSHTGLTFQKLKEIKDFPYSITITDLPRDATPEELGKVFSVIEKNTQVQIIDLSFDHLSDFSEQQLIAIFSHLGNVRNIVLKCNNLGQLNEQSLHAIFSHLGNVRYISLLGNISGDSHLSNLRAIFSHLGNVRSIDLSKNELGKLDEPRLDCIFSNLRKVRRIDLGNNYLGTLDVPRLQAIFSHLRNVKSIEIYSNDIGKLDKPSLEAIFLPLVSIERVELNSRELDSMIESLFPQLKGKL